MRLMWRLAIMGKGDTPRPMDVDYDTYASNWDRCFKKHIIQPTPEEVKNTLDELTQLSQKMGLYDEPTKDSGTEERSDGEGK